MTVYTDQEFEQMLSRGESDLVEFKESFQGDDTRRKVRETVCAFSNDLPDHRRAGVIFIGARDDGSPSGIEITDELIRCLSDIKTDGNILPPPALTVETRRLAGADVAVIMVEPADSPPVRYKGNIHIRTGSRRGTATAQDERILNEKRRFKDLPFDAHPVSSANLDDLDRGQFEREYLPLAIDTEVLEANDRTYVQRLASLKMVASAEDPIPTILGLLVLGIRPLDFLPGAYIQFLRVQGTEHGDSVIDERAIDGPVGDVLRGIDDKMVGHNRSAVEFRTGTTEVRTQLYPLAALQQIVRNAVLHRTYEATNTPVHVYWFDDRIEVMSPGGPSGVSPRRPSGSLDTWITEIRISPKPCMFWGSSRDSGSASQRREKNSRRTGTPTWSLRSNPHEFWSGSRLDDERSRPHTVQQ